MNKKLFAGIAMAAIVTCGIGTVSAIADKKVTIKDKIAELTEQFNEEKSNLESQKEYDTSSDEAKHVKELGIQIADLSSLVKTEADYKIELEEFIAGCKLGLEDTKKEQEISYNPKTQEFIEKMEKKLSDVEAEMKKNETSSIRSYSSISTASFRRIDESPSKKLLEKLEDTSDVEN